MFRIPTPGFGFLGWVSGLGFRVSETKYKNPSIPQITRPPPHTWGNGNEETEGTLCREPCLLTFSLFLCIFSEVYIKAPKPKSKESLGFRVWGWRVEGLGFN